MDTRSKIVELEAAVRLAVERQTRIVTGYFDPLTAAHIRRLREIQGGQHAKLVVIVTDSPDPILPARARAELIAALDMVEQVACAPQFDSELCDGGAIYREEQADVERFERLVGHVHRRHSVPSAG